MKIAADKWKSLSEIQKSPYVKKSAELKAKYEGGLAQIQALQKKIVSETNNVKGIVPKPKKKPKKVAKTKVKKAAPKKKDVKKAVAKKPAAKKTVAKKEPVVKKAEPTKAKKKQ